MSKIKITIPDGTPKEQVKMLKDWLEIIDSMEKLTGEEGQTDKKPILDLIEKLVKENNL